jgi:hypothetical protein
MLSLEVLRKLNLPNIGSIWSAPNRIWKNFAKNKNGNALHPLLVLDLPKDKISAIVVPGTSVKQKRKCVFIINLRKDWKTSHFLLAFRMRYDIDNFSNMKRGWRIKGDTVYELDDSQLMQLNNQISDCYTFKYTK